MVCQRFPYRCMLYVRFQNMVNFARYIAKFCFVLDLANIFRYIMDRGTFPVQTHIITGEGRTSHNIRISGKIFF